LKKTDKKKLEKLMRDEIDAIEKTLKVSEVVPPSSNAGDAGDMSQELAMEHTQLALKERSNKRLWELRDAVRRINEDNFGICEETGEPIDIKRLMLVPTTRLCTSAAQRREKRK
jgi:DnaK suppressor protein